MKQLFLLEILQKLRAQPELMRKFKALAVVAFLGFIFICGLTVWGGITAFSYVATNANEAIHSPSVQANLADLKTELKSLPKFQAWNCWEKAQSLIAVQPWLERPAAGNLVSLKVACFEDKNVACKGPACIEGRAL